MKTIWYCIIKFYIRLGLFFYYKKLKVVGQENIPKKGAVLFVGNHQNALIDPLIIATTNNRNTHFLTRAGVFKKKLIIFFFDSVQMIPIYRVRDGWTTLAKNNAIFEKCIEILNSQKALLIFPEGSHNLVRKVRPLSKGFTRILFGAIEKYHNLDIHIVPVGLNYTRITDYPSSAAVYYGEPILVNNYWDKNDVFKSTNSLKEVVHNGMKVLTTHIDKNGEEYDTTSSKLNQLKVDYLNPIATNKIIKEIDNQSIKDYKSQPKNHKSIFYYIFLINSFLAWKLWKKLQKGISESEFISSIRFGLGITLFPLFYVLQSLILKYFFGGKIALYYFIFSILTTLILTKISKD
jgi:1-acyl-sn-glycerol-3-phosphate acyltransferase